MATFVFYCNGVEENKIDTTPCQKQTYQAWRLILGGLFWKLFPHLPPPTPWENSDNKLAFFYAQAQGRHLDSHEIVRPGSHEPH